MFEVIEVLAGMVTSMLEFPVVGYLGRLVPAGGSEAGQQVRAASSSFDRAFFLVISVG